MTAAQTFSLLGDAILVYEQYLFIYGVAAFGVAQVSNNSVLLFYPLGGRMLMPASHHRGSLEDLLRIPWGSPYDLPRVRA